MPEPIAASAAPLQTVSPEKVFKALGHRTRITIIRHLATGATLCVNDFVPLTRMKPDNVGLHIRGLVRAGIVEQALPPDGDRRRSCFRIVPSFLVVRNGLVELDCGVCVVRLNVPATKITA